MERYFLNETEVQVPRGIDGLTRLKSRSRRYWSVLYKQIGHANGVGNVTFTDALSRSLLLNPYQQHKVAANTRFRIEIDGQTEFDAYVDYLTYTRDRDGSTCAFRDESGTATLENQATTLYSIPTQTSVIMRQKRNTGPATHTTGSAPVIVQRSMPSPQELNHALPLLRPDKAESTLPGQLLSVEKPLDSSPMYRNTTTDAQALRVSGRVQLQYTASSALTAQLVVRLYSASGQYLDVPQGELLVTTGVQSATLLLNANLLVQPGGWIVVGFRGNTVQRWAFTYGTDTSVTLESINQAPQSTCRGLLPGDLLSALVARSTSGQLSFESAYFSTGEGRMLLLTTGANLRGIDRPLTTSLQDVFEGLSAAAQPLALWIEGSVVRCEPLTVYLRSHARRTVIETEPLSLIIKPNPDVLASSVLTGFETWRGDGPLAGDEFNGSHSYITQYKTLRSTLDLRAKTLIGSGSLIEDQRRKQFSDQTAASTSANGNDDKLFVVSLAVDRSGALVNETRERTAYVSGLVDSETPINLRLSPRRSLLRWAEILPLSPLSLESAEGNADLISRYAGESALIVEADPLTETDSLLSTELAVVSVAMSQEAFNQLGDWITVYDEGEPLTGLLMDATWRASTSEGPNCEMTLFLSQ